MLVDFQQALADITSSPDFCNDVRADGAVLDGRYRLNDREKKRLLAIALHPGMACGCTVYRMNRLAPLAMNLRGTLRGMGPELRPLMARYWRDHPRGHSHFFIESKRFCDWLRLQIAAGQSVSASVEESLETESEAVRLALEASCSESI